MYPQKMPCTPKIQPLGVHVPSNKFVSGHAVLGVKTNGAINH